jgi:predicted nucleic acid-binding protein
MITARITQVEIMSAVSRLKREQMVTARSANAIHLLLDRHMHRNYTVLELTDIIVQQAIAVLSSYTLRAYDAVQLASALESNRRLVAYGLPPLIFVSADQRLLAAAIGEGLISENPAS